MSSLARGHLSGELRSTVAGVCTNTPKVRPPTCTSFQPRQTQRLPLCRSLHTAVSPGNGSAFSLCLAGWHSSCKACLQHQGQSPLFSKTFLILPKDTPLYIPTFIYTDRFNSPGYSQYYKHSPNRASHFHHLSETDWDLGPFVAILAPEQTSPGLKPTAGTHSWGKF